MDLTRLPQYLTATEWSVDYRKQLASIVARYSPPSLVEIASSEINFYVARFKRPGGAADTWRLKREENGLHGVEWVTEILFKERLRRDPIHDPVMLAYEIEESLTEFLKACNGAEAEEFLNTPATAHMRPRYVADTDAYLRKINSTPY